MIEPFKKKAIDRLKRARGQIDGIIKMIEEGRPCPNVLTQSKALIGAVKGVAPLVVESHLNTCGPSQLGSNDKKKRDQFIQDIIRACELSS